MKFAAYDDISIYGLDYARISYLYFYPLWYLRSRRGILVISPYAQLPAMQPNPVTKFLPATKPVTKPTVGGYLYFYTSAIPASVPSQIYICRLSLIIFRQLRGYLYLPQQMRMRRWRMRL
jgi:hypothetical protein